MSVVPFGKYKGKPVEVMQADPQYCEWLVNQDWFKEKFVGIYQTIINVNTGDAAETPEHNAMQARFLDRRLCDRLLGKIPMVESHYNEVNEKEAELLDVTHGYWSDYSPLVKGTLGTLFERKQVDVTITDTYEHGAIVYVELKPTMGDDYPAVIRQVEKTRDRLRGAWVKRGFSYGYHNADWGHRKPFFCVVVGEYHGTGATWEQVKMMFAGNDMHLLLFGEV